MDRNIPRAGEIYRHFKNKLYQIIGVATHSETGEKLVIYQALYGSFGLFARPLDMFMSEVDHAKYPEVSQKYRFELIDQEKSEGGLNPDPGLSSNQIEDTSKNPSGSCNERFDFNESFSESDDSPLLRFLDADDYKEKSRILNEIEEKDLNNNLIDNMAASIDVVIPEGELDLRLDQLKYAVNTKARYESEGLTSRFRVNVRK